MKNRNKIIAGLVALMVGSGLAIAGSGKCDYQGKSHWGSGHDGHQHGPKLERMIGKLDHHLDLSDQQRDSLESILERNSELIDSQRQERHAIRQESMGLDPTSETYAAQTEEIADRVGEMARNQALLMASVFKQVSDVLTEEQREEMRSLMEKRIDKMEKRMHQGQQSS